MQLAYYSFIIGALLQIAFWGIGFARLVRHRIRNQSTSPQKLPPVSVVICAKNEAKNIQQYLPVVLTQQHPNYEVVVVNDRSTDETGLILDALQQIHPHLKVIHLKNEAEKRTVRGKKYALAKGIEAATYETLLLTDADCVPNSPNWILKMQQKLEQHRANGVEIILGYAPMFPKKNWLNRFSEWETTQTAILYLSFALWRLPYMGVGRNLMYRKSLYQIANGFEKHQHIASGDDDLFIGAVANHKNTRIVLDPETFMYSEAPKNFRQFIRQKTRHLSTSTHYRRIHQFLLGMYSISLIAFHLYPAFLIGFKVGVKLVATLYVIRWLMFLTVGYFILKKLKVMHLWRTLPILDGLYFVYLILITPAVIFRNTNKWK